MTVLSKKQLRIARECLSLPFCNEFVKEFTRGPCKGRILSGILLERLEGTATLMDTGVSPKMSILEGSPVLAANPLLLNLCDTRTLYRLAEDRSPEARLKLCDTVAGLLMASNRPQEKELVADILISLIRQSERDLKKALAERMSIMEDIPLRIALQLVNEEIEVATPILRRSRTLNDLDLLYIIQSRSSEYWQVIAARENLGEMVVDALAETRDLPTVKVLVANDNIKLTNHAADLIGELALGDDDLARPLLMRKDVSPELARKLYNYVAEDIKRIIRANPAFFSARALEAVEDVLNEFTADSENSFKPSLAMLRAADMFLERGQLNPLLMIRTLKRGQIASFVAQFSRFCNLPVSVVMAVLQQKNGQGLAVACRAHEVSRDDFTAIFILTRRMVSSNNGLVDPSDTNRAIAYYDRIKTPLAKRLLSRVGN